MVLNRICHGTGTLWHMHYVCLVGMIHLEFIPGWHGLFTMKVGPARDLVYCIIHIYILKHEKYYKTQKIIKKLLEKRKIYKHKMEVPVN